MLSRKFARILATSLAIEFLVFAQPVRADAPLQEKMAILEFKLNEIPHGDIMVVFRGNDVLVNIDALRASGVTSINGRIEKVKDKSFISLDSITPRITFKIDEDTSTLRMTAQPEMFSSTIIDLRPARPTGIEYHTDTSAFINYSWTLKDLTESSGFVEAGLRIREALLTSTVFGSPQIGIVRGMSNITYDDRPHLMRLTIGDAFVSSGELGAGQFIGGVSITKNFSLDPYFVRQPAMGYSGSAMTPSTLDVYVNGARVRSTPVAPGLFQVQNLPVAMGTGNVRYVLRDAFGQEHAVDTRYSAVANQLTKGMSEFTYALGFGRYEIARESFDYRRLMGLGFHRFGLTDKVTLGMRLEGRMDLASGGATLQMVLPFGHASISGAVSGSSSGFGAAGVARIGYWSRKFIGMAMVQATSPNYATGSLEPSEDRSLFDARIALTVAPSARFSFSTDSDMTIFRDLPWQLRFGGSVNILLAKQLQLQIGGRGVSSPDYHKSGELYGMLTYAFGNGVITSVGGRTTDSTPETFASINKPMSRAVDMGFRAMGTLGPQPRGDAAVEMQGTQGRFMASAMADEQGAHATFQASGAFVAIKGAGVFATRPVQNGFAVLQVPGVKGVRGYLENQEIGTTDENGNLVIPNLMSYYGSRVRVMAEDMPLDHQIDEIERVISPPLRGGALVRFSANRMRLYRGNARVKRQEKTIVPSYGEIEVTSGKMVQSSPLGKNGEFELPDLGAGLYQAKITYAAGICNFEFEAAEGHSVVIDLGTLVCSMKGENP